MSLASSAHQCIFRVVCDSSSFDGPIRTFRLLHEPTGCYVFSVARHSLAAGRFNGLDAYCCGRGGGKGEVLKLHPATEPGLYYIQFVGSARFWTVAPTGIVSTVPASAREVAVEFYFLPCSPVGCLSTVLVRQPVRLATHEERPPLHHKQQQSRPLTGTKQHEDLDDELM